jgi:hypothetical protein
MNTKKITYILTAVLAIFAYNAFLAQRDAKLFEAYEQAIQQQK